MAKKLSDESQYEIDRKQWLKDCARIEKENAASEKKALKRHIREEALMKRMDKFLTEQGF
jgi:2-succinyl-5-enolpyruvyl-6-hydroxy-3-cyclohexene-1-carboxylate synthase